MNQRIFQKARKYIEKYQMIAPGDTIVAGVSGGADSVCMLLILYELAEEMRLRLVAVHVNHGIRKEEADADAAYAGQLCAERGIPFVLVQKDVKAYAGKEHLSEEEAGRKVRYEAFEKTLAEYMKAEKSQEAFPGTISPGGKIAVAHNANDRAETMLFHLFRGTGLSGISGIKPVRGHIIRPVLCLKREEIEEYLKESQIPFCIDRTNMEDTYTRNRIRNHIFPYVEKEVCNGAVGHMCETADMLAEAEAYIRKRAEEAYGRCIIAGEGRKNGIWNGSGEKNIEGNKEGKLEKLEFNADALLSEDAFIRRQVLLLGLGQVTEGRKDISSSHIREMERLLDKEGSKQISLPYGLVVRKEPLKRYSRLVLYKETGKAQKKGKPAGIEATVPGDAEVPGLGKIAFTILESAKIPPGNELAGFFRGKSQFIPQKSYTKWFDYDRITKSLVFRTREKGDYFTVHGNLARKKLKDYMIEEKIPREQREQIYVLAEGNHILWVPGYRISEYYKVTKETKHILQVQIGGGF